MQNRDSASTSPTTEPEPEPAPAQPLEVFFAGFATVGFSYRPASSAQRNLEHLCKISGWVGNAPERANARRGFQDALVQQFNYLYGVNADDIAAWHDLCTTIGIAPLPDDIDECRKRVWDAHVNIVDLIEAVRTNRPVRQFHTVDELATYTKKKNRFFPKENAYQGGLLRELLREIINPYFGKRRNGGQKRRARKARQREAAVASSQT